MKIEEIIEQCSNEDGFQFSIENVMQSLRPDSLYCLSASNGLFEIVKWEDINLLPKPTSQEIRDEYIRHRTIKEMLDYFKNLNKEN